MKILETKKLKKYYGKGDTLVKALDGVDLAVEDGEFVAIVGTQWLRQIHPAPHAGRAGPAHQRHRYCRRQGYFSL